MEVINLKEALEIQVNEAGDIITVHVDDPNFVDKFYDLMDLFEVTSKELGSQNDFTDRENIKMLIEKMKLIKEKIDEVFGVDCCKKVFGDISPSPYLVTEFFEQMMPILSRYLGDRQKKISEKYNRSRKGKQRTKEQIIQDAMR